MKGLLTRLRRKLDVLDDLQERVQRMQEALGRIEARQLFQHAPDQLRDYEFQVYSQWGEDGILQALTRAVPTGRKVFVEFGVEDYREANTRFLLANSGWSGLVIDGSPANIERICSADFFWRYNLKAVCAFITRDNINELLRQNGLAGDIGLLSIDIDGNDYWVWEAIDAVRPGIVVVEYNWRFGPERRVTVPYAADFVRGRAHPSMVYYGASLAALHALAQRKGFDLVGCNSAGNNAFFVRSDLRPDTLPRLSPSQAFVSGSFREARTAAGRLALLSPTEEVALLNTLPLIEVPSSAPAK
jgi:hypothetical protein